MATTFDDLIRGAEDDPQFWMQVALQEFVHSLEALMESRGVTTRARLAELVGVKPSTVSRWLNGNENVTVESMCKIAFAVGGAIHIHVADKNDKGRWRIEPGRSVFEILQASTKAEKGGIISFEERKALAGFRTVQLPDNDVVRVA